MSDIAKRKHIKHGISHPSPAAKVAEACMHEKVQFEVVENTKREEGLSKST